MENPPPSTSTGPSVLSPLVFWACFLTILLGGIAVRLMDTASWRRTGFDELIYRRYVYLMDGGKQSFSVFQEGMALSKFEATIKGTGAGAMPSLSAIFLRTQQAEKSMCELPPTRFLYIYNSWLWKNLRFGDTPPLPVSEVLAENHNPPTDEDYSKDTSRRDPALAALNEVACGFSIFLLIASGLFGYRLLGRGITALGVVGLMAFDPLQLHLSQHAMVDGYFAFWALMCLWTTWECLRSPKNIGWLVTHAVCLALMVMTKENAFFVYCALAMVVTCNLWLKFGTVTPRFLLVSVVAPAVGLGILIMLAGGVSEFYQIYSMLVEKARNLPYAQLTGDGPWYRYLVDLMTMSPIVLCLALGGLFVFGGQRRELAFLAAFVIASYLIMCNVRYGMNLRYGSIWSFPLRVSAVLLLWELCSRFGRRQWVVASVLLAGLCTYEFRQFIIFTANPKRPFYEVIPTEMLRQVQIIKDKKDLEPSQPPPAPTPAAPLPPPAPAPTPEATPAR